MLGRVDGNSLVVRLRERYPQHHLNDGQLVDLANLHVEEFADDLVLAWAGAGQDPDALVELENGVIAATTQQLLDRRFDADVVADSVQTARIAMLVGDPEHDPPRGPSLFQYRGRGPLSAFVRTACTRRVLNATRSAHRTMTRALQVIVTTPQPDIELEYMRAQYGPKLGVALETAWSRLEPHDRFVLGLALESNITPRELARVCGVHRATASRRLASARAVLLALARNTLRAELAIGNSTLDSILRLFTTSEQWTSLESGF